MIFCGFLSLFLLAYPASAFTIRNNSVPIVIPIGIETHSVGNHEALPRQVSKRDGTNAHTQANVSDLNGLAVMPVPTTYRLKYYANVGVGAATYKLLVDTGSAVTWIGNNKKYEPGPNSEDRHQQVADVYGMSISGPSVYFSGKLYKDDVTLGSVKIVKQDFGVASKTQGFLPWVDGILGLGPVELTKDRAVGQSTIPTVVDNLVAQKLIPSPIVGLSFIPLTSASEEQSGGEIHFGAVDNSKYTGTLVDVPFTTTIPSSNLWGVDLSITYGPSDTAILKGSSGIIDTGAAFVFLSPEAFQAYQKATGATLDQKTGFLKVDNEKNLQSLYFHFGGSKFELTPNAQIWPRRLNDQMGGVPGGTYLIVKQGPLQKGKEFILGFSFLQRFYVVRDKEHSRFRLATTKHTMDTTN